MILSHKHRFLFIKTFKTAGTSTELFLSQFCGPDDIITPFDDVGEHLRDKLGAVGPQNCFKPECEYTREEAFRRRSAGTAPLLFHEHMGYAALVDALRKSGQDPSFLRSYFKFCIERNPYDKLVSAYHFRHDASAREAMQFEEFLRLSPSISLHAGRRLWCENGRPIVDFVGRYEHLESDLATALKRIGIVAPIDLPSAKTEFRPKGAHYSNWFPTQESRQYVRFLYRFEMDLLGYEFEDRAEGHRHAV